MKVNWISVKDRLPPVGKNIYSILRKRELRFVYDNEDSFEIKALTLINGENINCSTHGYNRCRRGRPFVFVSKKEYWHSGKHSHVSILSTDRVAYWTEFEF